MLYTCIAFHCDIEAKELSRLHLCVLKTNTFGHFLSLSVVSSDLPQRMNTQAAERWHDDTREGKSVEGSESYVPSFEPALESGCVSPSAACNCNVSTKTLDHQTQLQPV